MTFKPFKVTVLLLLITNCIWAQKVEKKFNEKFYTNKDVVIDINASNTEIDVTTWDKNEVTVEAVIEVEGLENEEAQKYLDNWNFEVLGNKSKIEIRANKGKYEAFGKDNFGYSLLFFGLGLASIVAAIKYTVGKSAYGYSGYGDVFVFLFFGLLSVVGTSFL